ncbi:MULTISPECIES: FecR domain-containing protein [Pseudomonas]|jgi:transmembrane sensor|uniref:Iron dicitrate transport regulator FecR n=1 Tax=Pseudomonas soli TaxID=1306993 RepID=A0A2V4IVF8_9PSED|nr:MULTISPECIES: FecR domain-containing protein [Pseudomonas]PYB85117.1 iron dicitrate transport regulator FecR [Pseudomonas soli]QWA29645.1 FecR domain-containing protein [Pseudomonas sp. RC3H12]
MTPTDELDPRPIDAQAASWFSRNRNQPSRQDRKAFARWMQTPEHTRAYRQFEQLWDDLAALKQANRPVPLPVRRAPRWRPALATAAALLCAILAGNLGAGSEAFSQRISASQALQVLQLPDGSQLHVNAQTRLRLDFSAEQRLIQLEHGQLYIEVAPDKERPLFVDAGSGRVRVVGTGFDVRRGDRELVVTVAHGQVAFDTPGERQPPLLLGARQGATYDLARGTLTRRELGEQQVADWREGHVSFRNRELASLIDELGLYRQQPVVLADPTLGRYKVSGNLDVHDPDALLNALPALLPVKTTLLADGRLRIERR